MKTYSIVKRNFGVEFNNSNSKKYTTKEEAITAGNAWLQSNKYLSADDRNGWNYEVIENTENTFNFTGIAKSN
jgi:hypothetical protein